jgi:hypothetical protein
MEICRMVTVRAPKLLEAGFGSRQSSWIARPSYFAVVAIAGMEGNCGVIDVLQPTK